MFNENITDEEIMTSVDVAKIADCPVILQPEMSGNSFAVSSEKREAVFEKFRKLYRNVRLIPQVHKFMNVR